MQEYLNDEIGKIALSKKIINEKELQEILDFQKKHEISFGNSAIYLGLMRDIQVKYLLDVQAQDKYRIGDLLVEKGIVGPDKFQLILDEYYFHKQIRFTILALTGEPLYEKIQKDLIVHHYFFIYCHDEKEMEPLIKTHNPQLILLDQEIAKAGKISQKIKNSAPAMNFKIAHLSSEIHGMESLSGYEYGIDYILSIPFDKKHLVNIFIDTETQSMEKKKERILIVDDSPIVVESIASELRETGYAISIAKNGKEAIEITGLEKPDLITMDINMPVMDGYQACLQLKEQKITRDIPIIIVTTHNTKEERERGFEVGAVDYFTKPFVKGHLSSYIKHLLSGSKKIKAEKILIAEDSMICQNIYKAFMKKHGFEYEMAENGLQTMEILKSGFEPAAILLDISMPMMDGLEVCREIKRNDNYRNIPVIIVTAAKNKDDILKGLEIGANDYITKPFDSDELIARLEAHIKNHTLVKKLKESEERFKNALENAPIGMALVASDYHLLTVNHSLCEITGYSQQELLGLSLTDIKLPDENDMSFIEQILDGSTKSCQVEEKWLHKSGYHVSVLLNVSLLRDLDDKPDYFIFQVQDITKQKDSESKMRLAAKITESTMDGIFVTDDKGNITNVNPAFTRITGYSLSEVTGRNPRLLKSGRHDEKFYKHMWDSLRNDEQWQGEIWNHRKDGEVFPGWVRINTIKDDMGTLTNFVAILTDITARKEAEQRLEYLANHDALTGLPNRISFRELLHQALARAQRFNNYVALLFIDLDNFKSVNDSLGHKAGDAVLKEVAVKLKKCIRAYDTIARVGGDEFIGILQDLKNKEDAEIVSRKILKTLTDPILFENKECKIGASIGISIYPLDGNTAETLINKADTAMYLVKEKSKNSFHFYQSLDAKLPPQQ